MSAENIRSTSSVTPLPSRRTVAHGAVWTAPILAIGAAAPAMAASGCLPVPLVFSGTSGTSSAGVSATATSVKSGSFNTTTNNMTSTTINGQSVIVLEQKPTSTSQYQEITFTLSQPVYNLTFVVTDIDRNSNPQMGGYVDTVSVSKINGAASTAFTQTHGANVTGSGTTSSPWTPVTATPINPGDTTGDAQVRVTPTLGVTSFTVRYSTGTTGIAQQIYVGGISFTTTNCVLS